MTVLAQFHHTDERGRAASGLLRRHPDGTVVFMWRTTAMPSVAFWYTKTLLQAWGWYRRHRADWAFLGRPPIPIAEYEARRLRQRAEGMLAQAAQLESGPR